MLSNLTAGYFTLVYNNGEHRTLQVAEATDKFFSHFKGQLIVRYLNGTDNVNNYRWIGRVANGDIAFFTKVRAIETPERIDRFRRAFELLAASVGECGKNYAMASGNCWRCNRLLTHPASIQSGIGPDCAKKLGA